MITIELMGGLGNQLFQIFTVIGYSLQFKIPFFFQERGLQHGWRKKLYWDTFLTSIKPYLRILDVKSIWREQQFEYAQIPYVGNQDTKLFGYFQSYKYFDAYKHQIFELIRLPSAKQELMKKLGHIIDLRNSVSMHFRLGDYKKLQEHHPIISLSFYEQSLLRLCEDTKKYDWNVVYICEEEDVILVSLTIIDRLRVSFPNITFIKLNGNLDDWEQMLAMSLCRHNIIANSTFSWFGAYFNTQIDRKVYYPSVWFGPAQGQKYIGDLFPADWRKINIA